MLLLPCIKGILNKLKGGDSREEITPPYPTKRGSNIAVTTPVTYKENPESLVFRNSQI